MNKTPVLLLLFNRPKYTLRLIQALKKYSPECIYIHCDGPRIKNDLVNLIGYKKNIYKFMKNSNAFILTSNWEDPGFVIIEVAFCRTFIISSDCKNGPLEFIGIDGGLLFESNNIEDFKDKIKKFINLSELEIKKIKLQALKKTKNFTIFRHFINLNKILNY